jgi:hypothetical protein
MCFGSGKCGYREGKSSRHPANGFFEALSLGEKYSNTEKNEVRFALETKLSS